MVCIIPARGGSRGIVKKNVCALGGRPLISYIIEQALKSRFQPPVYVSTDCDEIEAVSKKWGAKVIRQPANISTDKSSSEDSLIYALSQISSEGEVAPKLLVFLQCTSPLTTAEDIDGTIESLIRDGADSALAVTPFHYFLWKKDDSDDAIGINHDKRIRLRRQDKDPEFLETGAVYVMKVASFLECRHRFFGKTTFHVIPRERVLEIDEQADILIAEAVMGSLKSGTPNDSR